MDPATGFHGIVSCSFPAQDGGRTLMLSENILTKIHNQRGIELGTGFQGVSLYNL